MLISEYGRNGSRNWDHGRTEPEKKLRKARVERFLDYCESRGVLLIRFIRQEHYDQYIQSLRMDGVPDSTVYKHQASLKEFVRRWRLNIRIRPCPSRLKEKRMAKIAKALEAVKDLSEAGRVGILDAIRGLI